MPNPRRKSKNNHPESDSNFEDQVNQKNNLPLEEHEGILALPSEINRQNIDSLLVHDGHFVNKNQRIVTRGSKVGTEFNSQEVKLNQEPQTQKNYIGRKNSQSWSSKIEYLRKKFGFSWQRIARKMAVSILLIGIVVLTGITSVAAVAIDYWNSTPSIERIERRPSQNSIVYARDGKTKIYEYYEEEKREVISNIDEIPTVMQLAVVALEDENYWDVENETGIPWKNLAGAARDCLLTAGDNCRGASGISQQLIKNMTDDDQRSVDRKVRELFIAAKFNQGKNKLEILKDYLNWVPFGRNAYGAQEASKAYFGRPINLKNEAGEFVLTAPEACYLASMIQKPSYYDSGIPKIAEANKEKNLIKSSEVVEINVASEIAVQTEIPSSSIDLEARKDACLKKLYEVDLPLDNGVLGRYIQTEVELETLKNTQVISTTNLAVATEARTRGLVAFVTLPVDDPFPHFREYITKELNKFISDRQLYEEGYEIVTTLDPAMQIKIDGILKENEGIVKSVGGDNASSVILDGPTGQILSVVGSLGYDREDIDGKVNIATSAQQPGSSIKPYVYAAAFKNGFNPSTVLIDVKTNWQGYDPKNFDGNFRGPVTMRRALQGSLNIPAVKSLFLVNDLPQADYTGKLDTFFEFTNSVGVRFPCVEGASNPNFTNKTGGVEICNPDADRGVTQEDVDNAFRGRCYIATALGGCELTMISHSTGMNTLLQEGNLRTATPFISIKKRSNGEDIYANCQLKLDCPENNNKQPYAVADADPETKLLARQMANVMSDYEARVPEFGSLRFNLELNDKRWRVAAKTGTSNGPRDFWTIGGSPYYTVALWAGKTDNGVMSPNASAGVSVARIWKEIMENLHEGKEVKNFSTEGLQSYFVRTGGTKADPNNPASQPKATGQNELLTPKQIEDLNRKSGTVSIKTPEDLEGVKKKDIFVNRTTLIPASYSINSLDGKLFVEGQTPEENRKIVECTYLLPEFPENNWRTPVDQFSQKKPETFCNPPTENSDQTGTIQPNLGTNIVPNAINNLNQIDFSASFPAGSTRTVSRVRILRNGAEIANSAGNSVSYPTTSLINTSSSFTLEAIDNTNQVYTKVLDNVTFSLNQLVGGDITQLFCNPSPANVQTSCNITINPGKTFVNFIIRIQGSPAATPCTRVPNATIINCVNVQTGAAGAVSGTPVTVRIDGTDYNLSLS